MEIKNSDIEFYYNKHKGELTTDSFSDGDIVKYNEKYYKLGSQVFYGGYNVYYELIDLNNGTSQIINKSELKLILTNNMFNNLVAELNNKSFAPVDNSTRTQEVSSIGGSGGGTASGYSKTRTSKDYNNTLNTTSANEATKNQTSTQTLSENIGTEAESQKTIYECHEMIYDAQKVISENNITVNKWENTQSTEGYATDASIVFLNNLTNAMTVLEKNLESTEEAAEEVNDLNQNIKELLVTFIEKKEKEEEKKEKEAILASTVKKVTKVNSNGITIEEDNPKYTKLVEEIEIINKEIEKINQKIEELQTEIDAKYKSIQIIYNNLIHFDSSSKISIIGDTIFGKDVKNIVLTNDKDNDVNRETVTSDEKVRYSIPTDPVVAAKKALFIPNYDDSNAYTHYQGDNLFGRHNELTLFDNTTGEIISDHGSITLSPGETRVLTVKLPTDTGQIYQILRTTADGNDAFRNGTIVKAKSDIDPDPNNIEYVRIAEAGNGSEHVPSNMDWTYNNCYDWVITADKRGSVKCSQTCLWTSEDTNGRCLKAMINLNVNVKSD